MSVVTFRPIGRLGNNMFQTAACIGYAKKYGYEWKVPHERYRGDTDPWILTKIWPNLPTTQKRWIGERYDQHDPKDFNFAPIPDKGALTIVGFFQSEKWFENAKDEVRAAFPLKYYPQYEDYVSIHVRRGDYVQHSGSFPPVGFQYLNRALEHIIDSGKLDIRLGVSVCVFSDDIEWFRGNAHLLRPYKCNLHMRYDDSDEFTALSKMASCSHHIIANSTFSWWGAWLGFNPNRIVCSPSYLEWFGPQGPPPPVDLIPDNWIQISTR